MSTEVKDDVKEKFKCGRCGWTEGSKVGVADEEREEYLRAVLGGKPYHKTFKLFDGKVSLTFKTQPNHEVDKLTKCIFRLLQIQGASDEAQEKLIKIKLLFYLDKLELGDNPALTVESIDFDKIDSFEAADEMFKEYFGLLDETIIRAMVRTYHYFVELQQLLIAEGFNSDFWDSAGLL